jgi:DNA-binding response OmpR family regulator
LSHLEFDLFLYFTQNKWKVLSRQEIYEKVWWEYDEFNMWNTVDVYIGYLRKKFGKEMIETKKWFWYVIQ